MPLPPFSLSDIIAIKAERFSEKQEDAGRALLPRYYKVPSERTEGIRKRKERQRAWQKFLMWRRYAYRKSIIW